MTTFCCIASPNDPYSRLSQRLDHFMQARKGDHQSERITSQFHLEAVAKVGQADRQAARLTKRVGIISTICL